MDNNLKEKFMLDHELRIMFYERLLSLFPGTPVPDFIKLPGDDEPIEYIDTVYFSENPIRFVSKQDSEYQMSGSEYPLGYWTRNEPPDWLYDSPIAWAKRESFMLYNFYDLLKLVTGEPEEELIENDKDDLSFSCLVLSLLPLIAHGFLFIKRGYHHFLVEYYDQKLFSKEAFELVKAPIDAKSVDLGLESRYENTN